MLATHREGEPVDSLAPVLDCEQVASLQAAVRQVRGRRLDQRISAWTSSKPRGVATSCTWASSTRGALALYRAAQAAALVAGRPYVVPDDVKQLAVPVLAHRVIPKGYLHGGQREAVEALIERLVEEVPVPG